MKKITLLFSAAILLSATFVHSQPLVYNLRQGETYRTNTSLTSLIKQSMMGQSIEVTMQMEAHVAFRVAEVTATGYRLTVSYSKIASSTSVPGMGSMSFSSDENAVASPGSEAASRLLRSLMDTPFLVEITRRGEITNVSGLTALGQRIAATPGASIAEAAQLQAVVGQLFNDETFKAEFQGSFIVYPDRTLTPGDSWTQQSTLNSIDAEVRYTVTSLSNTALVLSMSSTIDVKNQETMMQGMPVIMSVEGTQKGAVTVNRATGWLISGESAQNVKGEVEMQGMKIPMEVQLTSIVKGE